MGTTMRSRNTARATAAPAPSELSRLATRSHFSNLEPMAETDMGDAARFGANLCGAANRPQLACGYITPNSVSVAALIREKKLGARVRRRRRNGEEETGETATGLLGSKTWAARRGAHLCRRSHQSLAEVLVLLPLCEAGETQQHLVRTRGRFRPLCEGVGVGERRDVSPWPPPT